MVRITPEEVIRRRQLEQQTTDELDGLDRAIVGDVARSPAATEPSSISDVPTAPALISAASTESVASSEAPTAPAAMLPAVMVSVSIPLPWIFVTTCRPCLSFTA